MIISLTWPQRWRRYWAYSQDALWGSDRRWGSPRSWTRSTPLNHPPAAPEHLSVLWSQGWLRRAPIWRSSPWASSHYCWGEWYIHAWIRRERCWPPPPSDLFYSAKLAAASSSPPEQSFWSWFLWRPPWRNAWWRTRECSVDEPLQGRCRWNVTEILRARSRHASSGANHGRRAGARRGKGDQPKEDVAALGAR